VKQRIHPWQLFWCFALQYSLSRVYRHNFDYSIADDSLLVSRFRSGTWTIFKIPVLLLQVTLAGRGLDILLDTSFPFGVLHRSEAVLRYGAVDVHNFHAPPHDLKPQQYTLLVYKIHSGTTDRNFSNDLYIIAINDADAACKSIIRTCK